MKERPILFNSQMVRAILDGRKTQTRRLMNPQPETTPDGYPGTQGHLWPCNTVQSMVHVENELQNKAGGWEGFAGTICPLGQTGDRLWVRESLTLWPGSMEYKSDGQPVPMTTTSHEQWGWFENYKNASCPSIHMPRWASRITLEITDVRVERLQDISEKDSKAEGVERTGSDTAWKDYGRNGIYLARADDSFRSLWESINGAGSWSANPWVWVVEFKKL